MSKARVLSQLSFNLASDATVPSTSFTLANSGVTAGTYGSASQVPILAIDAKGRVTSASTTSVAGVSSFGYNTSTGVLTINTADGGSYTAGVTLAPFTTTTLSEGTNQYFTNARARLAVSATGSLSYNSTTGVFSYTQGNTDTISEGASNLYYTDSRARAAVSASTGLSYNSTTGVFTNTITQYTDALAVSANTSAIATAKSEAISAASTDATNKANAAQAAAIVAVTNGAGAAFDTLKEIQDAMATDVELAAAISAITIGNGTQTISAGTGLSGGGSFSANQTASSTVTLGLGTAGTAGTYTKVTTDAYGRVVSGTTLSSGDIPSLSGTYLPLTGGTLTGAVIVNANEGISAKYETTDQTWLRGWGIESNRTNTYLRPTVNNTQTLQIGSSSNTLSWATIRLDAASLLANGNQVLHAGNYTSYALPLTGGSLTGPLTITGNGSYVGNYGYSTLVLQDTSGYPGLNYRNGSSNWLVRMNAGGSSMTWAYSSDASAQDTGSHTQYLYLATDQLSHSSSMRAPIFYDSNDTGYYINPNSQSNISRLVVYGGDSSSPTQIIRAAVYPLLDFTSDNTNGNNRNWRMAGVYNSYGLFQILSSTAANDTPSTARLGINGINGYVGIGAAAAATSNWLQIGSLGSTGYGGNHIAIGDGTYAFAQYLNGGTSFDFYTTSAFFNFANAYTKIAGAVWAPIFYDSSDTGYYVDPASVSMLNVINFPGSASIRRTTGGNSPALGYPFSDATSTASTLWIEVADGDTGGLAITNEGVTVYGAGDNGSVFRVIDEDVYQGNGNNVTNATQFYVGQGPDASWFRNQLHSKTDMRAPIFYDYDNTATWLNPSVTSGTILSTGASNDTLGYNSSYGIYIGGINGRYVYSGNSSYTGPVFWNGSGAYTIYHSGNFSESDTLATVTARGASTSSLVTFTHNTSSDPLSAVHITGGGTHTGLYINPAASSQAHIRFGTNGTLKWQIRAPFQDSITTPLKIFNWDAANDIWTLDNSGNNQVTSSFRAPIFYDSNDTAYYVDPNDTSRISKIGIGGSALNSSTVLSVSGTSHFPDDIYTGGTAGSLNSWGARWWTTGGQMYWGSNGANFTNFGYGTQITTLNIASSGSVTAYADFRAPIFYDSNDTTYYLDPNNTSTSAVFAGNISMNGVIVRRSAGTGYLSGNYGSSETTATTGAIYTIGGSYYPTSTSLNNIYGIGYTYAGVAGGAAGATSSGAWGLYVASNGSTRVFLDSDYGRVLSTGDMRAPLFYDYNDTGYYTDPNAGTNLKYLQVTGDWNGSPFGSGNETFTIRSTYASFVQRSTNGNLGYWLHHIPSDGSYMLYGGRGATDGSAWDWSLRAYPSQDGNRVEIRSDLRSPIFYDYNDTNFYVDPNNTSTLNLLNVQSLAVTGSTTDRNVVRVIPKGAAASYNNTVTGAFKIRLPIRASDTMWQMTVKIYDYSTNNISEYQLGNYSYSAGAYNNAASFSGSANSAPKTVRFGNDGSYDCVWIGETTSAWSHPVIAVTEFVGGYANASVANWDDNWNISLVTSFDTIAGTINPINKFYAVSADSAMYAPIYYDSNDTGYYIDSNAFSKLTRAQINWTATSGTGGPALRVSKGWDGGIGAYAYDTVVIESNDVATIRVGEADGTQGGMTWGDGYNTYTSTHPMRFYTNGSASSYIYNGMSGTLGLYVDNGSARSPIFYDYNDTAYYLDPTSTTSLRTVGDWRCDSSSWTGEWSGKIQYHGNNWYFQAADQFIWRNSSGSNVVYGDQSGNHWAVGSSRSPIFYDNNDTGYYVDPNSVSVFKDIRINDGNVQIRSNNVGRNTKWRQLEGSSDVGISFYNAADTWCMQLYANAGSEYGFLNANWGSWDLRKIPSGNLYMNNNNSYYLNAPSDNYMYRVYGAADIRSPIYYDLDNTGYYVDPNSTSRMGTINADTLYSYGNVTAYSDERLKTDWEDLPIDFIEKLAKVKSGTYTRIDSGERQTGVGAQSLQVVLKEAVSEQEQYLGVNYGNAALVSAVELAKKVVEQEERIKRLEALVETLINKLGE